MYRKLVICVVPVLGLVTLVASAQQSGSLDQSTANSMQPLTLPGQAQPFAYSAYGSRTQREEIELSHKSAELVKQLAKAEGEKRDKIKDQLTDTIGKQFDARQKRHEDEIKVLENQVRKLKELVRKRQDNRREIVSRRLEQLLREAEGLGW